MTPERLAEIEELLNADDTFGASWRVGIELLDEIKRLTLTWTTKPPTVPGFYGWRETGDEDSLDLTRVREGAGNTLRDDSTCLTVEETGGEWCGPVVFP